KLAMKVLKLPPQRAANAGVVSKALSRIPKQRFRMKNPNVLVMAGLRPGHPRLCCNQRKTWMPGSSPRLSGLDLVDKAHGVDSSRFWTSASVPGHEWRSAPCRITIQYCEIF